MTREPITGWLSVSGLALAMIAGSSALAAEAPNLMEAYSQQLVRQCGGKWTPDVTAQIADRIDFDGDKIDDWVVDAGRYPCPTRPAVFADQGAQVTVFMGDAEGRFIPRFQRAAFGARLEGKPSTGLRVWLTMSGDDCGAADPKARCDRQLVWLEKEKRLTLAELAAAPPPRAAAR